jgi:hypothetical protein
MASTQYDLPPGIDKDAVERMRFVARVLDDSVRIPGIGVRVGLDPVLGIVPGAGDVVAGALSLYVVVESARLGVSWTTLLRMLANVGVDTAAGFVPLVGSVCDVFWKANRRNVELALADLDGDVDDSAGREAEPAAIEIE